MDTITPQNIILNIKKERRFGKTEYITQLLTNEFLEDFKLKNVQYKKKSIFDIRKDWANLTEAMSLIVMDEPDGIQIGNNLGEFKLGLLRIHNVIDRIESKKLGKDVKYMNFHTNRKLGKFIWKTEYARKVHFFLRYLGFTACRTIQQSCFKNMIKQGNNYKDVSVNYKSIK